MARGKRSWIVKQLAKAVEEQAAAHGGAIRVRLLTDSSGIDDRCFNESAWKGIQAFYGECPATTRMPYDHDMAQTQDLYFPILKKASEQAKDLIVVAGFTWSDALGEVAKTYPNQKYLIVDVDWINAANVMQTVFAENEGSYLAGAAVALKAKSDGIVRPKFGFIGGVPGAVITKFEVGYVQGILSVLPKAEILDYYAYDWGKPEMARDQAKIWFDSGVYAIFSAAGGTGNGTIDQAKDYRAQGKNVWAIGIDGDQYQDGMYAAGKSAVLTSMVKRVDNAVQMALKAVKENRFRPETVTLGAKEEGIGITGSNAELDKSILDQVEAERMRIASGDIKVARTYKEAKTLPGFPKNLKAKDQ